MSKNKGSLKLLFIVGFILAFVYLMVGLNIFNKDILLELFTTREENPRLWNILYRFYNTF